MVELWNKLLVWLHIKEPMPTVTISAAELNKIMQTAYTIGKIEQIVYADHPFLKLLPKEDENGKTN